MTNLNKNTRIKVLLIKRGALGDVLMTTPLIRNLRKVYPHAQIDFLVSQSASIVLKANPYLSNVIIVDDQLFAIKKIFAYAKFLAKLSAQKYDYVLVLDKHFYFAMLSVLLGGMRLGFARDKLSLLFLQQTVKYTDISRYQALYYLDLLNLIAPKYTDYTDLKLDFFVNREAFNKIDTDSKLDFFANREAFNKIDTDSKLDFFANCETFNKIDTDLKLDFFANRETFNKIDTDSKLDFFANCETFNKIENKLNDLDLHDYFVVVNSGGNNQYETTGARMLPSDKIIELLEALAKIKPIFLIGNNLDKLNYQNYLEIAKCSRIINTAGKLTLEQSVALMVSADKIFTTDCGSMHLALSQGLEDKLHIFFAPTNPGHVLPDSSKAKYVWEDQELFDPNYQLKGKINSKAKFFTKLDIRYCLKKWGIIAP